MQPDLPPDAEPARREVCAQIPEQECGLKEEDARVPDGRTSAESRQRKLREHGLDQKQQARPDEHCHREKRNRPSKRVAPLINYRMDGRDAGCQVLPHPESQPPRAPLRRLRLLRCNPDRLPVPHWKAVFQRGLELPRLCRAQEHGVVDAAGAFRSRTDSTVPSVDTISSIRAKPLGSSSAGNRLGNCGFTPTGADTPLESGE